ncbi:apolipoprotein A-IV-like [Sorex fumeus]|uniref:apolipoprotein A-IV-like n=1 Tax=Sorex fumeus TaxID=62283 RepID=UPI0024AD8551|nr:apolipoprotein A-IV-like [Sorex fumeus]
MILKAVILSLALVAVSGDSEVPPGKWPEVSDKQVAAVVCDYFSQQNTTAKEEEEQKSELTQQLETLFQNYFWARLQDKPYIYDVKDLVPFAVSLHLRLTQESDKLKEEIRKEQEELRARMLPHAQNVSQSIADYLVLMREVVDQYLNMINQIITGKRQGLEKGVPLILNLIETALRDNGEDLPAFLTSITDRVKNETMGRIIIFEAYQLEYEKFLMAGIDQKIEELRRSLAPFAQDMQDKLDHQLEGLFFQMKKHADQLQANISAGYQELCQRLKNIIDDTQKTLRGNSEEPQKAVAEMGKQYDQQLEEFQRTLALYKEPFEKAMVQLVEEFGRKLVSPNVGEGEDYLIFLEKDLKDKVKSFFNTIKKESQEKHPALQNQDKN